MAKKHRIRITGRGIHGAPSEGNPTGEYPVGYEFETEAELPAGWVGRAVIVGEEPKEGSEFITGNDDDDSEVDQARREVIAKAQEHIDGLKAEHDKALAAANARADKAEAEAADLRAKLAAFDHDGNGAPGGSKQPAEPATADDIKAAVALLDKGNDDHWTAAGLPAVDAITEIAGKPVSRAAITEAAPDAKRPTD